MLYKVFYYDANNPKVLLGSWNTSFLPKIGDYATLQQERYVVTDVTPPNTVQEFQPAQVVVLCQKETTNTSVPL